MFYTECDSGHFTFRVLTDTKEEGLEAFRQAWHVHAKQYQCSPDYGMELIEGGDVAQCELEPGVVYRDWEPLPKEFTPVWRIHWGHSGGPHRSAWEASQYASEVMGEFAAETTEEALRMVEAEVGAKVRSSCVRYRRIDVLFEEEES